MSDNLDRMTDRTRKVLRIAAAFNHQNSHGDIENQDVVDALAQAGGISDHVLEEMGYQRKKLPALLPDADQIVRTSDTLKPIVAQALQEARSLGHNYVGTEHLLLAMVQTSPELLPDPQQTRAKVLEVLGLGS